MTLQKKIDITAGIILITMLLLSFCGVALFAGYAKLQAESFLQILNVLVIFGIGSLATLIYFTNKKVKLEKLQEIIEKHDSKKNQRAIKFGSTIPKGAKFPVGMCVISRTNSFDDPTETGIIVGYYVHDNCEPLPVVQFEKYGNSPICFSVIVPYSDMMMKRLEGMTNEEQYKYLVGITRGDEFISLEEQAGIKDAEDIIPSFSNLRKCY